MSVSKVSEKEHRALQSVSTASLFHLLAKCPRSFIVTMIPGISVRSMVLSLSSILRSIAAAVDTTV